MTKESSISQKQYDDLVELVLWTKKKRTGGRSRQKGLTAYWRIGRLLSNFDQVEQSALIGRLAAQFDVPARKLQTCAAFYQRCPQEEILLSGLSWSHFQILLRLEDEQSFNFYLQETLASHWSTQQLKRQLDARFYERSMPDHANEVLKDPLILEFLQSDLAPGYQERELENALLNKLQAFLLELGKGFAFVARQKRIFTESGRCFYIDLVFYHFILKCFVLIDLKTTELSHQDIGQMDMYVRLYEEKWRQEEDQPTLGVILCTEKDHTIVKYSMLNESRHLFASRYQLYLPAEEELLDVLTL